MSDKPIKILLVEDNLKDARLVKEMLTEANTVQFQLTHIDRLSKALESLARESFDIILLDLSLPDIHGLDTVIQTRIAFPGIPIVVMSGLSDEELAIKAVQEGAQDYLVKGQADSELLIRSMRYAIERKRTEEALRESESKYRAIFENTGTATVIIEEDATISLSNTEFEKLSGYSKEEIEGKKSLRKFVVKDDLERMKEYHRLRRIDPNAAPRNYEFQFIDSQGNVKDIFITIDMIPGTKKSVASLLDITERKQAEEALRTSACEWRATFDAVKDTVFLVDIKGIIHRCNKAMTNLLGKTFSEIIGHTYRELEHSTLESTEECFLRMQETHRREITILSIEDRWIKVTVDPMLDKNNSLIGGVCVISDITERKQAEEALRRAREDLEIQVEERTAELVKANEALQTEIMERKRAEEKQSLMQQRLEAQWKIARMVDADFQTLCNHILVGIDALTKSHYGFYGFLNEDQNVMTIYSWSSEVMNRCQIQDKPVKFPIANAGLWGCAVRERGILIINDYKADHPGKKGLPEGHVPLTRLLVVPIFSHGRIVALAAVANKATEYTEEDAEQINAFVTSAQIILEKKQAEEALRKSEASLVEAQRIAHMGNWDWDIQTNELHWSDEIYCIFGLTPQEFGATYDAFLNSVHPDDREFVNKAVNEALYGMLYSIDHRIVLPDGTVRIVHEQGEVTFGENGEPIRMLGTVQDITEKKENEIRLIMSERLAALGQMASGIAHEINNPLATIAACAEGLLNRMKKGRFDPGLFESYLKIINEEIIRCKSITTSMLSFVRKTTYERKDIDINYILDKTIEIISFQGRLKEVEVIRDYKGMPVIQGSEGELRQVFLVIVMNALDAMEDRGTLTLETGIIPQNPSLEKGGEGGLVFIKISDSGPGISSELISRIFDPFFTTKSEKGGVGLGLSIANKIITDYNGSIDVTSKKEKGTTFKITLPI